MEQHISFIESFVECSGELSDKGTAGDVTKQTRFVRDKADELLKLDDIKIKIFNLGCMNIALTAVPCPAESGSNTVGNIEEYKTKSKLLDY